MRTMKQQQQSSSSSSRCCCYSRRCRSSSNNRLLVAAVTAVLMMVVTFCSDSNISRWCAMGFQLQPQSTTAINSLLVARQQLHLQPQHQFPTTCLNTRAVSTPNRSSTATTTTAVNMVSYEDLMERIPSTKVITAVEKNQDTSTGMVVASDVAASAGVSLSQARKDLAALASLSRGDIAVSSDGELLYSFPKNLNGVLAQNSAKYKAMETARKAWPLIFWAIRCSFGVALLASILAIFSTIFFLQSSSSSSDDDNRGGGRGGRASEYRGGGVGFGYNPWFGPSPFDVFYYRPYGYYGAYGRGKDPVSSNEPPEMGFLESVYSYIFGDGNPNGNVEERRLQLASSMIRGSGGAVTAEQLAPFCDEDVPEPSTYEDATYVDESFVLPIVTALNGEPQVTDDGEIVYVFPEMQTTGSSSSSIRTSSNRDRSLASAKEGLVLKRAGLRPGASASEIQMILDYNRISSRGAFERDDLIRILEKALPPMTEEEDAELVQSDPTVLQEREWKFSLAPDLNKFLAGGLGVLNLGGALYLGNMLNQYASYGIKLPAFYGTVQAFFPALLGYAVLFNAIPLVRNFWTQQENQKIAKRNQVRRKWQTKLREVGKNTRTRLGKKLQAAARWGKKVKLLGKSGDDIVFDTSKPFEETQIQKEQQQLKDFDKLLKDDSSAEGSFE